MDSNNFMDLFKQVFNKLQNIEIERDIIDEKINISNVNSIPQITNLISNKINNIKGNFNEY